MRKVTINTADLSTNLVCGEYDLGPQAGNISTYYGIPYTLVTVDSKFKTHTFLDVIQHAAIEMNCLVDDGKIQVLDPKSSFVDDEQFAEVETMLKGRYDNVESKSRGFESQIKVELPESYNESFTGDVFKKQLLVTRRPEGGLSYGLQIERLICTNGSMVADKSTFKTIRKPAGNEGVMAELFAGVENMSINEYLMSLFMHQGEMVPCSVADMTEMASTLQKMTGEDATPYPLENIAAVYASQDIDINKLSRQNLAKLPSGFSYYEAFNVLTHGAKQAEDTLQNKIEVAKYYKSKRMKALSATGVVFSKAPSFSKEFKHHLMGDVA